MDPLTCDSHRILTENKLIVKTCNKNLGLGILTQAPYEDSIDSMLGNETTYRELFSRQQTIDRGNNQIRLVTIDVPQSTAVMTQTKIHQVVSK